MMRWPVAVLAGLAVLASPSLARSQTAKDFECVIEPALLIEVASPVGGLIGAVSVDRGDRVTQGQEIARLESGIEETTVDLMREQASSTAEIEAYRARLTLAQSRRDRLRSLVERNISPQGELEEAEAGVAVAEREGSMAEMRNRIAGLELKRAEEVLNQRIVRSPIDGLVVDRLLFTGEYAASDTPLVRIAQLDPLHVEAFIPVEMFGRIDRDALVTVYPAPPILGSYVGRVIVVDQVFDAASGTFGIVAEIANPDLAIPAGHRCSISFAQGN